MTMERRAGDHGHSEYANIREVQAVKDELLHAMAAMEARLTARIEATTRDHADEHRQIRERADTRHQLIDDFISGEKMEDAKGEGVVLAFNRVVIALRYVNEFRWILLALIGAALFLTGNVHLNLSST